MEVFELFYLFNIYTECFRYYYCRHIKNFLGSKTYTIKTQKTLKKLNNLYIKIFNC